MLCGRRVECVLCTCTCRSLCIAFYGKPVAELQNITCRMASRDYLPLNTGECALRQPQPDRPVLDLPTPEGWKAELILVVVSPVCRQ